uniref:Uncharacterized protein n=1 Tax=Photinus pyralis TaxID=7054 RepID=A0A1Y1K243_PHOPY
MQYINNYRLYLVYYRKFLLDDDDIPTTSKPSYADKLKHGKKGKKRESSRDRTFAADKRRRSLSNDRDRNYRRRRKSRSIESRSPRFRRNSRSRKRTTSRERYRRRSHSRSRDHGRRYKPRRSSTSSSSNNSHKSRSRSRTTYRSTSRNRYPVRAKSSSSSSVASPNHSLVTRRFNKSRSSSIKKESPPKTTVQRYYGRKRSDQSSSSELEDLSDLENGNSKLGNSPNALETKATSYGNAVSAFKVKIKLFRTDSRVHDTKFTGKIEKETASFVK